jgi:hypothetical protein
MVWVPPELDSEMVAAGYDRRNTLVTTDLGYCEFCGQIENFYLRSVPRTSRLWKSGRRIS